MTQNIGHRYQVAFTTADPAELIESGWGVDVLEILSGDPLLAPAADQAVREARSKPVLLNDEPIAVVTELTVNFTLSQ